MLIQVHVTKEDISEGFSHCRYCPIALAIKRTLRSFFICERDIQVNNYLVTIALANCRIVSIKLPYEASTFISYFDEFKTGKPFSFEMEIPSL